MASVSFKHALTSILQHRVLNTQRTVSLRLLVFSLGSLAAVPGKDYNYIILFEILQISFLFNTDSRRDEVAK